jgi:hypothetical protein
MRHSKFLLGAIATAAVIGFAAPATATPTWTGPITVTTGPKDCLNGTGVVCTPTPPKTHFTLGGQEIGYAGPLTVSLGAPVSIDGLIVWCDDIEASTAFNTTFHNYFVSDPAFPQDVVNYLNVGSLTVAHEIMGLTARGTFDDINGQLTPELGAAFQAAIWELEYGGSATLTGFPGFQSLIDSLIADATTDYNFFTNTSVWLVPWTFSQLESPCDANNVGLVTKDAPQGAKIGELINPNCQRHQGFIVAIPGTQRESIPEPITLSLFGAGIAGVAAYRRRRKNLA